MICSEKNGSTRGAMYQRINTFRRASQQITPLHPPFTEEAMNDDNVKGFQKMPLSYEDYYQEVRERYINGFLMMITYQCDALVEKFNVTALIIGLVPPICLRFLALSGGWLGR